jgi:hypothetical protein
MKAEGNLKFGQQPEVLPKAVLHTALQNLAEYQRPLGFEFRTSNLFRISNFEFRILFNPSYGS